MPSYFEWMQSEQDLTAAALTVRVQSLPYNDQGRLMWETFFPRQDVPSVKIRNITTLNFRPVADRREWNARGRYIPLRTPKIDDLEMIPIESYFKIAEREIQELTERTFGNEDLFRQIIGADIPTRTDSLAVANYRRIEVDAMTAWALGQVTARNPIRGDTVTMSFGYDSTRYVTATPWTGGAAGTAYANFVTWLRDTAQVQVGPCVGAMMRLSTMQAIISSAPNQFSFQAGVAPTRGQVEQRVQDELGSAFQFYVNEQSHDIFSDGGLEPTRTKVWPAHKIAAIPAGLQVGFTGFAPVARAYELAKANPAAQIDVRGMTAFTDTANQGRELTVEVQANAFPIPNEQLVSVIDAGI